MIWVREVATGKLFEVNDTTCRLLGLTRKALLGAAIEEFCLEEPQRHASRRFASDAYAGGAGHLTTTLRSKGGAVLEVELRASRLDYDGIPSLFMIGRNIGGSTKDARLRSVLSAGFEHSNDVMFYCDPNGIILDVNEAFVRHYGYTRAEVVGKTPGILRSPHSTEELYQRMWRSILDPKKGFWRGEIVNRAKDGRELPLVLTITAVRGSAGEILGYISNGADLTDLKALEERVAHAEALATIGEMAAVVAHEIRNPLGSIVMAAQQLADEGLSREDRETVTGVLRNESKRLNETLTNFLSYARPRNLSRGHNDLNKLLREISEVAFANGELAAGVRLISEFDETLKTFSFDADQVRQVVWNILLNAIQACAGSGQVTVRSGQAGSTAWFSVADTGPGIAEKFRPEIFKPFRTTKQQGTGLGLAIADRIVKAHRGSISLGGGPGQGATFKVVLPRIEE
jgi:PAS domain S-box-containing protein